MNLTLRGWGRRDGRVGSGNYKAVCKNKFKLEKEVGKRNSELRRQGHIPSPRPS